MCKFTFLNIPYITYQRKIIATLSFALCSRENIANYAHRIALSNIFAQDKQLSEIHFSIYVITVVFKVIEKKI
jgi:hypothetical protein